jgi:hypothetical protein
VGHGGRPAGKRGWQVQPRKVVEYEHRRKKQRKGRSSGCRLQVGGAENGLLAIRLQSSNTLFSAARTSNSRCLVLYLVQRCDARDILFERCCPEQRPPRAALKIEAPSAPLERAGPLPRPPPPPPPPQAARSSRVVGSCGRGVVARANCRSYFCSKGRRSSHFTHP